MRGGVREQEEVRGRGDGREKWEWEGRGLGQREGRGEGRGKEGRRKREGRGETSAMAQHIHYSLGKNVMVPATLAGMIHIVQNDEHFASNKLLASLSYLQHAACVPWKLSEHYNRYCVVWLVKDAHQHLTMMVYTPLGHPGGGGWQ